METLRCAFAQKYPANDKILGYFEEANGVECTWENLSKIRLQKFVDHLYKVVAPNSVKTYCAKFKSVLRENDEEVQLPKDFDKVLSVRKDASQHVYLSEGEINALRAYVPKTRAEHAIKNWFLIGCLTGARHSDYVRFTENNISDGSLKYVSIKTHTNTTVPLSPFVASLIEENQRYGYNNYTVSDSYFNRALRKMCRDSGITDKMSVYCNGKFTCREKWTYISSHTARRSFATNLYKAGVDIYTISRYCGHSSVEMTKQYICCAPKVTDEAMAFFNSFTV